MQVSAVFHVIRGSYELWTEHQSQNLKDFNSSRSRYRNELRQHLDVKDGHMKLVLMLMPGTEVVKPLFLH